jgi:hypothetical protein
MKLLTKDLKMTARALGASMELKSAVKNERSANIKMHLYFWTGSRRHMTLVTSYHDRVVEFLNAFKVDFETGNDAPRGGATGNYISAKKSDVKKALLKFEALFQSYPRKKIELTKQLRYL